MLKPIRIGVATLAATAAIGLSPTGAGAADMDPTTSAVTATVTAGSVGSRTITALPVVMTSVLNSSTLSGSLSATVTEAARTGTNAWSVTAAIGSLSDGATPANTLANTNMTVSSRRVDQVAGGGVSAAAGGTTASPTTDAGQAMGAARTLFSNSGQLDTVVYTGTYASTSNWTLALPNGTKVGAYTGTITLTLVQ